MFKAMRYRDDKALACVAGAWKQWAKERTGAREGDFILFYKITEIVRVI